MLLDQSKLTKSEWDNVERPIEKNEMDIVDMIAKGFHDPHIRSNHTLSLMSFLKVANMPEMEEFIYIKYIEPKLEKLAKKYGFEHTALTAGKKTIKKADMLRIQHADSTLPDHLFEFALLDMVKQMYKRPNKRQFYHYTLRIVTKYNVPSKNRHLMEYIQRLVADELPIDDLLAEADTLIEQNDHLRKYADLTLYEHQKRLFTVIKRPNPSLVLYVAPTGTGKTLSPIGLSEGYRIIFVCAARHVGLSLARTAISMKKKVAFAFGCEGPEDIRLHYFAAKNYTKNRRTGGIGKVDNSVGDNVEIMITDVKSYLPAMYYMLAFNKAEDMVMYWDEPTITLDYEEHECHSLIQRNWSQNEIPNVVLSSATLPSREDLVETTCDFQSRFANAECHSITSHDCKRSIQLVNSKGFVTMPHHLTSDYDEVKRISEHCEQNKTLYRYFDLKEASDFILRAQLALRSPAYEAVQFFEGLESVTMENIKRCYIHTLRNIRPECWSELVAQERAPPIHASSIHIATGDAHTLTNGPTIFLANDIEKIAKFYLQEAKIPESVMRTTRQAIRHNRTVEKQIHTLQIEFEDGTSKDANKERKMTEQRVSPEMVKIQKEIDRLNRTFKDVSLDGLFVPNSKAHLERYAYGNEFSKSAIPFSSRLEESVVSEIMQVDGIEDTWKLLLLMGIGVFAEHKNPRYTEIMKQLAQQQCLYLIIASTDYIYGTNYQFCHGYIGRDLQEMTQEKCIQAIGRVGRNHTRQQYTVRFRHDPLIHSLFSPAAHKPEVANMARLFNSAV